MRVVCIDDNFRKDANVIPLVKGNIYTVIDTRNLQNHISKSGSLTANGDWFRLLENNAWYHASLFIPINENQKDETELIKERELQTA